MFINLLKAIMIMSGLIAIVTFVMYGRARMKEQDLKEKRFLQIHYTCLFVLMLLGIVYMFLMVETES